MRLRPGQAGRGQAAVELAVTLVMFTSVLLLGLFLADVGHLSLKVQEAANFALFDAAGRRFHKFSQALLNGNPRESWRFMGTGNGLAGEGARATARYEDFLGLDSSQNPAGLRGLMSHAQRLSVECATTASRAGADPLSFGITRTRSPWNRPAYAATRDFLSQFYADRGGLQCTVSARVTTLNMPTAFFEQGANGFATEALLSRRGIPLCGAGRAMSGSCRGTYAVLGGDWGFEGDLNDPLNRDVPQARNGGPAGSFNSGYRQAVQSLFQKNGGGSQGAGETGAHRMMRLLGEMQSGFADDRRFLMSYVGYPAEQTVPVGVPGGPYRYNTSGVFVGGKGKLNAKNYKPCFLGQKC